MDDQRNEYINYGHIYQLEIIIDEKYGKSPLCFENIFRFFHSLMHKRDNFWWIIQ